MSTEFISNLFRHGNVLKRRRKGRTLHVSARHRFGRWDRGAAFGPAFIVAVRPCCGRIRSCARVAPGRSRRSAFAAPPPAAAPGRSGPRGGVSSFADHSQGAIGPATRGVLFRNGCYDCRYRLNLGFWWRLVRRKASEAVQLLSRWRGYRLDLPGSPRLAARFVPLDLGIGQLEALFVLRKPDQPQLNHLAALSDCV
jgi:hypothetical protein